MPAPSETASAIEIVARFGGIYEHSSWVAKQTASQLAGLDDIETIANIMADCVDNASNERQLALIRAHPDLACKAQVAGVLTENSSDEQSSAGLDHCSADEYEKFQILNNKYHEKFGFPFVMAVRHSSRAEILAAFENRLGNDHEIEFETALSEIHNIARLRLRAMGD
ncbi:MAG: 2-oxo-4-hydroxy-4-carboxy-5-ureidoimidazoline decarboxylase [Proteobacteria bacterium]|nr:2-oxo-4-hydroxy-4-carboxy-5-ureidoimidazoline decarboxylase [Pseudomonadota bacterium]